MKTQKLRIAGILLLLALIIGTSATFGFYDPAVQRWVNRDPIEEDGGVNLYEFVLSRPVSHFDRDGRQGSIATPAGAAAAAEAEALSLGYTSAAQMRAAIKAAAMAARIAEARCKRDRCKEEWEDARKKCAQELTKPNPDPVYTQGGPGIENCARGFVSEDYGGNPVSHRKKKQPRVWIFN